ncbi:MAG: flagellar biosynthesis anti-sigma factor FlgM [Planctomycetes bacterium]|nr:flagellar biosynthesis anti-sigma factor FlgM [Planctomycetota bacterium]
MSIVGVNLGPSARVSQVRRAVEQARKVRQRTGTGDSVELSEEAQQAVVGASEARARVERIARIRQQIREGTYDTEEKFRIALNRMIDSILAQGGV